MAEIVAYRLSGNLVGSDGRVLSSVHPEAVNVPGQEIADGQALVYAILILYFLLEFPVLALCVAFVLISNVLRFSSTKLFLLIL